jgi:hypothetical protein
VGFTGGLRLSLANVVTLRRAITAEVIALAVVMTFVLPGGQDLHGYYLPMASGCLTCGFAPYHTAMILWPLTLIPAWLLWPVWTLTSCLLLWWAVERLGGNPAWLFLSFPFLGQIWLGQIDALVVAGLTLAMTNRNPYLRGLGLTLASIKPHLAGVAIIILLYHERERMKALAIPLLALALSLILFGPIWPLDWFLAYKEPAVHIWRLSSLYPIGLSALAGLIWLRSDRDKTWCASLSSAIGMPDVGCYSYVVFLSFPVPWWAVPLSYSWILYYPFIGLDSLRFAWILPVVLYIGRLTWPVRPRMMRHKPCTTSKCLDTAAGGGH